MKERAPDVLDFIATVATPKLKRNVEDHVPLYANLVPRVSPLHAPGSTLGTRLPVCMSYGMMMNQRWQELSLVQKIATVILRIGQQQKGTFFKLIYKLNHRLGGCCSFKFHIGKFCTEAKPPNPL